jgi:dihydrofolate reductase
VTRLRAFLAVSVDGFIAGPNDDLSWLPPPDPADPTQAGFREFLAEIGALLMGRRTYDVVAGFGGEWPYGDRPVFVATTRPLPAATPAPTVRRAEGPLEAMIDAAVRAAGPRDVYVDGGALVRAVSSAGRLDEMTLTTVPVVLGAGTPLFDASTPERVGLELVESRVVGSGLVQSRYRILP